MTNQKPKVGFIILSWNSKKYIKNCCDSIMKCNSFIPYIVIVDNGSTDGSSKIINKIKDKNSKIGCIFLSKNFGTTRSRNLGIKKLREYNIDYLCVLDSDTIINNDAIMTMLKVLSNHSIGIVGPAMKNSQGIQQVTARKFPTAQIKITKAIPFSKIQRIGEKLEKYNIDKNKALVEVDYLLSACWLMSTQTFNTVGFFDDKIFYAPEDVDYCRRTWLKGKSCCLVQNATIIHEYQRISKKKIFSKINFEHIKGLIYYFCKHHYIFNPYKKILKRAES